MMHVLGYTLAEYTMDHPHCPESLKILDDYPPEDYSKEALILIKTGIFMVESHNDIKRFSALNGTDTPAYTKNRIDTIIQKCENLSNLTGDTFSTDKLRHFLTTACPNDFDLYFDRNEWEQKFHETVNYKHFTDPSNEDSCIQHRDPEEDLNQLHDALNKEQDIPLPDIQEPQI